MAMGAVVTTQIGNVFAHRSETVSAFRFNPFSNRLIWTGIATELTLLCLLIYVPFFWPVWGMMPFPWPYWLFLFAWTPALLLVDELRKALLHRHTVRRAGSIPPLRAQGDTL
jgi:magnesium-transporting ATPase (P-type)